MSRIVVSQFVTVDGVVEDPGGAESFEHGGWAFQFERGPDGDKFKLDEVMGSDALLLGRVTYEGFAAAWPSREGEFADKFNTMPKYVVSSTLDNPEWNNSTVIGLDDLSGLRDRHERDILVNGSVAARAGARGARARRRVPAHGLPGHPRQREEAVRRRRCAPVAQRAGVAAGRRGRDPQARAEGLASSRSAAVSSPPASPVLAVPRGSISRISAPS